MSSFVFIDARVQDYERLISGLAADVQVAILDLTPGDVIPIAARPKGRG